MGESSAVIGSGGHVTMVTMVAMVDSASGIGKSFMKPFINGIILAKTNPTFHTLKPNSSPVENFRSV